MPPMEPILLASIINLPNPFAIIKNNKGVIWKPTLEPLKGMNNFDAQPLIRAIKEIEYEHSLIKFVI
jgi:hypothetical protein